MRSCTRYSPSGTSRKCSVMSAAVAVNTETPTTDIVIGSSSISPCMKPGVRSPARACMDKANPLVVTPCDCTLFVCADASLRTMRRITINDCWSTRRGTILPVTSQGEAMSTRTFYGWKLLAVFWLVLLVAAAFPLYGGGVMNAYMAADLQMERSVVGLPMSVYQFVFGLGAPVVGLIVDRCGIRATLIGGALLIAIAALLMGFIVSGPLSAILVFGVLVGLGGAAAGGITTQSGVARWFTRKRALAMAILMSAPGFGGFLVAPLINRVIVAADG
ncbi:MAG: MFS transporter, partial [Lysobacterales bacterium]